MPAALQWDGKNLFEFGFVSSIYEDDYSWQDYKTTNYGN
jgi:hypothetical protein